MKRMRTFFLYALGIVGFIFLSYILEDGLISGMYKELNKENSSVSSSEDLLITDVSAKASYMNGYMNFKLTNNSNKQSDKFLKIELFSKQGLLAVTDYVPITDLDSGNTKNYEVKFKGNDIDSYKLSVVDEVPDKSNIINVFGWEVDLSNVFGMDLTNATIFGVKLSEIFKWDNLKTAGGNAWSWTKNLLASVPWWGYAIASGIILWYMPVGYLFGIFPL